MDTTSTSEIDRLISGLKVTEAACPVCDDSGYVWDAVEHRILSRCECQKDEQAKRLAEWKKHETYKLKSILLPQIDLTTTKKKPWYDKLPESGGVWLSGAPDEGKTHAVGWMLARKIDQAKAPFQWVWFSAHQVFKAWVNQYESGEIKYAAGDVINKLEFCKVIVIDDFDKTGRITQAREEELFALIDSIYRRGAELLVPSNIDIQTFCSRMESETALFKQSGVGASQRRLNKVCAEIKL